MVNDLGSYVEMGRYWGQGVIGEGSVGESSEECCEMMVDGYGWVKVEVVGSVEY